MSTAAVGSNPVFVRYVDTSPKQVAEELESSAQMYKIAFIAASVAVVILSTAALICLGLFAPSYVYIVFSISLFVSYKLIGLAKEKLYDRSKEMIKEATQEREIELKHNTMAGRFTTDKTYLEARIAFFQEKSQTEVEKGARVKSDRPSLAATSDKPIEQLRFESRLAGYTHRQSARLFKVEAAYLTSVQNALRDGATPVPREKFGLQIFPYQSHKLSKQGEVDPKHSTRPFVSFNSGGQPLKFNEVKGMDVATLAQELVTRANTPRPVAASA